MAVYYPPKPVCLPWQTEAADTVTYWNRHCVDSLPDFVSRQHPTWADWGQLEFYRKNGPDYVGFVEPLGTGETAQYWHWTADHNTWDLVSAQAGGTIIRAILSLTDAQPSPWRLEHPDGTITWFRKLPFPEDCHANHVWQKYLDAYGQAPRQEVQADGRKFNFDELGRLANWTDPDGTRHAATLMLTPDLVSGVLPFAPTDTLADYIFDDYRTFPPTWFTAHGISDDQIRALVPSVVAQVYYQLLNFQMFGRKPRLVPDPWFSPGCSALEAYVRERSIRNRIYTLRSDLWWITDDQGKRIPGLIPPDQFPAYNGLRESPGLGEQIGTTVVTTLVSFIPVIGLAVSIGTWAAQIATMLRARESLAQLKAFGDAAQAALPVLVGDTRPSTAPAAVPGSTPTGSGSPFVDPNTPAGQVPGAVQGPGPSPLPVAGNGQLPLTGGALDAANQQAQAQAKPGISLAFIITVVLLLL